LTGVSPPSESAASSNVTSDPRPRGLPINLAAALKLAGVAPLDIAAATVQVQQGLAVLLQAKSLWIPNINGGVDYSRHDGKQQNIFTGALFQKGRQSFFVGGGPYANFAIADAVYEPLVARRVVAAREADVQTARNDALLSVAQAYFALQDARGRLVGADATIVRARRLVDLAVGLAPGLIAPLEINRSKAELQSLLQTREVAIRDWRVASAALAEILLLEPETLFEPIEPPFVQVSLIPADETAAELVSIAINNRPEIASQRELLAAANNRLKQEKTRPFLPNILLLSPTTTTGLLAAGNLAGGPNAGLGANAHSAAFEVAAVWELQNAGIGNIGRIRQRRAEQDLAAIDVTRTLFRVRADVSQALARLQTARARVPITEYGLWQATESADKNFIGLRETTRPAGELLRLVVRPQEVVAALIALELAFEQYSSAVNDYNAAQFALYRALGQPAQWVTSRPPPLVAGSPGPTPAPPPAGEPARANGP
jgi:outer membrane protein TolC